jgi:excisionase family DNA binding protein
MNDAVVLTDSMTARLDTENALTAPQAAKLLGIGRSAIHQAIKRGKLKALKFGGVVFINRSDLTRYQKTKSVGGRPKKKKK